MRHHGAGVGLPVVVVFDDETDVALETGHAPSIDLDMQRTSITPVNGDLLLFNA